MQELQQNETQPYQCQRCKMKECEYVCSICKPINYFCSKCDSCVHTLPSKKNHKRELIKSNSNQIEKFESKERVLDSPTRMKTTNRNSMMGSQQSGNANLSVEVNEKHNFSSSEFSPQRIQSNNNSYFEDKKFSTSSIFYSNGSSLYSREFVNELKSIFEKEKQELIFKNNSLQSNLDRLKNSINDQIQFFQRQQEENNSKNNNTIKLIDEEFQCKMKILMNEKDQELSYLKKKIDDYKNSKDEILLKLKESLRNNKQLKKEYKEDVNLLKNEVAEKQEEISSLISEHQNKIDLLLKENSISKKEIINQYEVNMDRLSKENEKLNILLNQKDNEFYKVVQNQKDENIYFNQMINDLKLENKSDKDEIYKCIQFILYLVNNENSQLFTEIGNLKNNSIIEKLKNEISNKNEKANIILINR